MNGTDTSHPFPASAVDADEWSAIQARRALLREQLELVAVQLPWLSDPSLIPDAAIVPLAGFGDVDLAAFSLAAWMLIEIVRVADGVNHELGWRQAFERHRVPPALQGSVARSVLLPAARHAPGLFAMAEIVSVVPKLAHRAGFPQDRWRGIVAGSELLARHFALGNTAIQVLLRCYLSRATPPEEERGVRSLDPAKLRLDENGGLTTVTPLETLSRAARRAAARGGYRYVAPCVAMSARIASTGAGEAGDSVFGAIWATWVQAANRLLFSRFDPSRDAAWVQAEADPDCAGAFDAITAQRRATLSTIAADPYPEEIARVFAALLESPRRR